MTSYLIKGASILGGEPTDVLLQDGRVMRPGWSRCPGWSTSTPTSVSPDGRTPRPC
jgi:hypothetical protein